LNKERLTLFAAIFFLCLQGAPAAEKLYFRVYLFHAPSPGGESRQQLDTVLLPSSHPELAALNQKVGGSNAEFTAGLIDSLMEIFDLDRVEDLFLQEKEWDGRSKVPLKGRVANAAEGFSITINPKPLRSGRVAFVLDIARTTQEMKTALNPWQDLKTILKRELETALDEPVILGAPFENGAYFAAVLITKAKSPQGQPSPAQENKVELVSAPNAIKRVQPSYPEELRLRGIGGEIGVQVTVNESGAVIRVDVLKRIHPYLDFTVVQAFRKWTFEPVIRKGKPVSAAFRCGWNFDPGDYRPGSPAGEALELDRARDPVEMPGGKEDLSLALPALLEKSGDYCDKLSRAAFDFVCDQTIQEVRYSLLKDLKWVSIMTAPKSKQMGTSSYYDLSERTKPSEQMEFSDASQSRFDDLVQDRGQVRPQAERLQIMDPKQTRRNDFVCDYMFVRTPAGAKERRLILKENGRTVADRKRSLEDERYSGLTSLLAPLRILAKDRQGKFDFVVTGKDKIRGTRVYLVDARPKSGDEDGVWSARIWVDGETGQVLKCEIEGVPVEGYEDVLVDSVALNIRPSFIATHEYRNDKKGILFPYRSTVRVEYPGVDPQGPIPKIASKLSYDKYRFFTVGTEHQIVK
jgi:TonB family protein